MASFRFSAGVFLRILLLLIGASLSFWALHELPIVVVATGLMILAIQLASGRITRRRGRRRSVRREMITAGVLSALVWGGISGAFALTQNMDQDYNAAILGDRSIQELSLFGLVSIVGLVMTWYAAYALRHRRRHGRRSSHSSP